MKGIYILSLLFAVLAINGFSQDTLQEKAIVPFNGEYGTSKHIYKREVIQRISSGFEKYIDYHKDALKYISNIPWFSPNTYQKESFQSKVIGHWSYMIITPFQEKQTGGFEIYQKENGLIFKMNDNKYLIEIPIKQYTNTNMFVAVDSIGSLGFTVKYSFLLVRNNNLQITVKGGNIRYLMKAQRENNESEK